MLIRPFVRREAVLSSRIEGTQASLGELLAAEAGAAVDRSPDDLHEVANYVVAVEHGIDRLPRMPLSLRLVREIHEKLMHGVRGDQATPGEFRRTQNWIGRPGSTMATATYVPPPPDRLMACLAEWETFVHDTSMPPLVQAALSHSQFEAIHPFLDGNGRVGRLLISLLLITRHVLPSPLLYLSAYFDATRAEYYARLSGVTERGEWEEWIEYFLVGVATQADDAVARIRRVDGVMAEWRRRLSATSSRLPDRVLELLLENPFGTVNGIAARLGVAFTSAQRAIDRLESARIVERIGKARRNRVYCAREILDILEEPAVLSPSLVRDKAYATPDGHATPVPPRPQ